MTEQSVSTLAPRTSLKERKKIRPLVGKVVRQAAREYAGSDLLEHVYLAGLFHGAQLGPRIEPTQPEPLPIQEAFSA